MKRERSRLQPVARSSSRKASSGEQGFSLVEVLISMLILTTGLVAMAQLMGVTAIMHMNAREATRGTQLAQAKIDELMKQNMTTSPAVQINAADTLAADVANYFDTPAESVTRRWRVQAGPAPNTRILTVRVLNARSRQYGSRIELTTLLRQW